MSEILFYWLQNKTQKLQFVVVIYDLSRLLKVRWPVREGHSLWLKCLNLIPSQDKIHLNWLKQQYDSYPFLDPSLITVLYFFFSLDLIFVILFAWHWYLDLDLDHTECVPNTSTKLSLSVPNCVQLYFFDFNSYVLNPSVWFLLLIFYGVHLLWVFLSIKFL